MKNRIIIGLASAGLMLFSNIVMAGDFWGSVKRAIPSGDIKRTIYKVEPLVKEVISFEGVEESLFEPSNTVKHDVGEVTIYTTQRCGYCTKARDHLRKKGIQHQEHDVEKSEVGKRDFRELKGRGVPIILVGKERMDGYDQARLQAMLERAKQDMDKKKAEQEPKPANTEDASQVSSSGADES